MPLHQTSRRSFLAASAALSASVFATPAIMSASHRRKQLHVAAIGVNGMGWTDLSSVGKHPGVQFVGFCDIDDARFDKVDAEFKGVPHYSDYRVLLNELEAKVDAVIVATPDHMHAPIAMAAMQMGKHVYCQKPLTHTVWEARQMKLMAAKMNLTTQMGNQIHSAAEYRLGVRLIQDGAIGKVKEVHSWVGVQGRQYNDGLAERPTAAPTPPGIHWDLWLGAAPERPFAPNVYHPFNWRNWQDFGSGAMGDFGCHILDPVFNALGLQAPTTIVAENDGTNNEVWPGPETITFQFPGNERTLGQTLNVIWRDGGLKPTRELAQLPDGIELPGAGSIFIGEGGVMLLPHVGKPSLYSQKKVMDYKLPDVQGTNHWHDWVDAVLNGKKTTDGFDYAGPLTETVQLGNIAARLPRHELTWNAESMMLEGHEQASRLLTRSYRSGFAVTAVEG
ncbi:MAG: Gfo/Idh/MocA family protein [Planctomycetota bacterium]